MNRFRTLLIAVSAALTALLAIAPAAFAQAASSAPPAGGAAIGQVIVATAGAVVLTSVLLVLGIGHRTGRIGLLGRAAAFTERMSGLPGWASLPSLIAAIALIVALFGMMWDISIHIAQGRDEGPLANPAHYFILAGLFGIFSAGFLSMVLPTERPGPAGIRIAGDWYAPLGGVLIAACGAFSLVGFPLDDVWHRLFGQDVTLWGPTHLMLIGGAAMTLIGEAVLLVEGSRAAERGASKGELGWVAGLRRVGLTGAFLIGLSTFQAEFDFGVPQFRLVFGPMLVMLAAGCALVAARVWIGRGGAIGAALFFVAIRGLMSLLVGPAIGEPMPHFHTYVAAALLVELVAIAIPPERTLRFALVSGTAIGTIGLAAEWAWSQVWMPIPWPSELFPEGAILGLASALAGAVIGGWVGAHLASERIPRTRPMRWAGAAAALAVFLMVGYALQKPAQEGVNAHVTLADASREDGDRMVDATVRIDPPSATDGAELINATAWQGDGLHYAPLDRVGPATYRTTEPLPASGDWKSLIRLSRGDTMSAVPVYMPADPAIPVKGVPAADSFTRPFVAEHEILQREQKTAAGWLSSAAYGVVLTITVGFLVLLAWGLHRLATAVREPEARTETRERRAAPRVGAGQAPPVGA